METQQKRQWGVTSAISEAQPTEGDLKLNDKLIATLKEKNNFESPEGIQNRNAVLAHLQKIVEEFIRRAGKAKGLPPSSYENAGGRLFTFGSFALGVSNPGSDIDTLVVAPKHVTMSDFFEHFPPTFHEMTDASEVDEFNPVADAFVPIITIKFRDVDIDLLFASLPTLTQIPKDMELSDKAYLRGLDDQGMRSINGARTVRELLDCVPQHKPFRLALRAIKSWSKEARGIYGAIYGYPGGIAWAIMVARICQLYPYACAATILIKFFNLMGKWHWPRPVMLKTIEEGTINLRVWNPTLYPQDRAHLMPIITPAFPSMCSTHTITLSTKDMILKEFKRAEEITGSIVDGKKSWTDLFVRHTFFTKDHRFYLSVIASCYTKEAHEKFQGLVTSKVRLLIKGIDEGVAGIEFARPFPKEFHRVHQCDSEDQRTRIREGSMNFVATKEQIEEREAKAKEMAANSEAAGEVVSPQYTVYTTTYYIGLTLPISEGKPQLDISYPVADFKRFVTSSETYEPDNMFVSVVLTRNHDLPDDVFVEGETRPVKPVKEKKKKSSKSAKRPYAETGLNDSAQLAKRPRADKVNGQSRATPV